MPPSAKRALLLGVPVLIGAAAVTLYLRHPSPPAAPRAAAPLPAGPQGLAGPWRDPPARAFPAPGAPPAPPRPLGLGAVPPAAFNAAVGRFQREQQPRVDRCLNEAGVRGPRFLQPQVVSLQRTGPGAGGEIGFRVAGLGPMPGPATPPGLPPSPPGQAEAARACVQQLVGATLWLPADAAGDTRELDTVLPVLAPPLGQGGPGAAGR